MVAWWFRWVTLVHLGGAVVWLAWMWPQSVPWAVIGAVVWLLGARIMLGLQFMCMAILRRSQGEPPLPRGSVWRAWNAESRLSARTFGWEMPWAEDSQADYVPDRPVGSAGVVLVHGWLCNRAMWADALYQLRVAGVPCIAVSMPMLLHRIGTGRGVVDAAVGNGNTMVVFRFRELLNHEQTSVAFGMTNFAFVMNKDAYANLSPEGRATIDGWRGERLSRYLGAHQNGFMEDFNSEMLAAGDLTQSELEPAELVRWQEAIAPVTAKWIADTPDGQKIYDTFVAEYDKVVAAKN